MLVPPESPLHAAGAALVEVDGDVTVEVTREPIDYDVFLPARSVERVLVRAEADGVRSTGSMIEKHTGAPTVAGAYLADNARREFEAFGSDLLHDLAPGVRAPRLFHRHEDPDGALTLWLEDVRDESDRPLATADVLAIALDLGRLAGRWAGRVPDGPRLFTGWIERHSQPGAVDEGLRRLGSTDPTVMRRLGSRTAETAGVARAQPALRALLESLPSTLCHHDAVGSNTLRSDGSTVLIDWESVGPGPVGADLASLIFSSIRRGDLAAAPGTALVESAFRAYAEGVSLETDRLDAELIRRGFDGAIALRWKLVRDVVASIEDGTAPRRGSAPHESPDEALDQLDGLIDLFLGSARSVLG